MTVKQTVDLYVKCKHCASLADHTNGRAYATVLRLSSVCRL